MQNYVSLWTWSPDTRWLIIDHGISITVQHECPILASPTVAVVYSANAGIIANCGCKCTNACLTFIKNSFIRGQHKHE